MIYKNTRTIINIKYRFLFIIYCKGKSVQLRFNVHIQTKLLQHTPVMGTHSSYELGCLR